MNRLVEEYLRSLKLSEAEEWPDTLFFRPVAFGFVKAIYRTPITPNHVSLLSLIAGLASAWCFSIGDSVALLWGGLWMLVANVLDCADGQLARLQQSGTMLGRIIDGLIDYIIGVAVFIGLGIGLQHAGLSDWMVVLAAALSIALHASMFDRHQGLYIRHARGAKEDTSQEMEKFRNELDRIRRSGGSIFRSMLIQVYLRYLQFQRPEKSGKQQPYVDSREYVTANRIVIRFWTLLGPSTNRTLLIVCAFMGDIPRFLWIVVGVLNILLLVLLLAQRRADARLSPVQK